MPRTLCDPQVRADRRQQIRGKNVVNRDEVSLLREALKFTEVRLDHRGPRGGAGDDFSSRNAPSMAWRIAASGARRFIQISHCAAPCARNISTPDTVAMPLRDASFRSWVLSGR